MVQTSLMSKKLCIEADGEERMAFTDPDGVSAAARADAIELCSHCPAKRECAKTALRSGTNIDALTSTPADGVIAAGIHCRGTRRTTRLLAEVAGVEMPRKAKRPTYDHCVSCELPMLPCSKDRFRLIPDGYTEHYARGHCKNCRSEYAAARKQEATPVYA